MKNLSISENQNHLPIIPGVDKKVNDDVSTDDASYLSNPFLMAMFSMLKAYDLFHSEFNGIFSKIEDRSNRAFKTKDMANRMDEIIANISKKDEKATAEVPIEVANYMRDNGLLVGGETITDYLKEHHNKLNLGELTSVKASLDNSYNADSNFMDQQQIIISKCNGSCVGALQGAKSFIDSWNELMKVLVRV